MKNFIYSHFLSVILICYTFCFHFENKILLFSQWFCQILIVILLIYQLAFILSYNVKKKLIIGYPGAGRQISGFSDMTQLLHHANSQKRQGKFVGNNEENCFAKVINIFWLEIFYYIQRLKESNNEVEATKLINLLFGSKEHEIRELLLFQLKIKKISINDIDNADYEEENKIRNEIRFIVNNFESNRNEYFKVRYNKSNN